MPNEEIKKDIEKYSAIEAVLETEGGKLLKEQLESAFMSLTDELMSKYKTNEPIIPIIAQIDSTLQLLRTLIRSESNKNLALEALKTEENKPQES